MSVFLDLNDLLLQLDACAMNLSCVAVACTCEVCFKLCEGLDSSVRLWQEGNSHAPEKDTSNFCKVAQIAATLDTSTGTGQSGFDVGNARDEPPDPLAFEDDGSDQSKYEYQRAHAKKGQLIDDHPLIGDNHTAFAKFAKMGGFKTKFVLTTNKVWCYQSAYMPHFSA